MTTNGEYALEVRDLYVGYYKDLNILQGVNMKARKGWITAILGANGWANPPCSRPSSAFSSRMPGM